MSLKRTLQLVLALMLINAVVLVAAGEAAAQERIDDWYGQEFTELHAQLKYTYDNYGEKFKYKEHGGDRVSLTMTDYRDVECEYISLDNGYTVSYRVDHYTKKEYGFRKEFIQRQWGERKGYYVLQNKVVALFDDKKHRIGFALLTDLQLRGIDPTDGKLQYNPIFIK